MINKIVRSMAEAMDGIQDGATVLLGGFGAVGQPNALIDGLVEQGARELTVACNNAGVETGAPFADITEQAWRWVLDVNVMGVIHGCRIFLPLIRRAGEGHIVNTGSGASFSAVLPTFAPYVTSKFAILGLTESLDVNAVAQRITDRVLTQFSAQPAGLRVLEDASNPIGVYSKTKPVITELPLEATTYAVTFSDGLMEAGKRDNRPVDPAALLTQALAEG